MAEPIGALRAELSASSAAFAKDMAKARRAVKAEAGRMRRSFDMLSKRTAHLSGQIFNLRNAAVAAAGVAGLALLVRRAIATADAIGKQAKSVSLSAEALQEYRFAARRAGVDSGGLDKALTFLSKSVAELKTRTSNELTMALKEFNPELLETLRNVTSNEDAFRHIADAIANAGSEFERAAIARAAFGRSGLRMIEMLRQGSAGLDRMSETARRFGIVISNEMIRRAEKANDELDDMADVFKVAGSRLALEFMPLLQDLARIMVDPAFQQGVKEFGEDLRGALQWVVDNSDAIIAALGAITGLMLGARLGAKGAIGGALVGGVSPFALQILDRLGVDISKLTNQSPPGDMATMLGADAIPVPGPGGGSGRPAVVGPAAKAIANLERERALIGATNEQRKLSNLLKQAGVDLDTEQGRRIEMLVGQIARETEELRRLEAVAETVGDSMSSAFDEFIETGKVDFKDMVDSMLKDLARLAFRMHVIEPLVKGLPGLLGGAPGGGIPSLSRRASGGPVMPGEMYLVGERGQELFVPGQAGQIVPLNRRGGAAPRTEVKIINNSGAPASVREGRGAGGGRSIEVTIGEMVGSQIRQFGSPANQAVRAATGGRSQLTPRG